MAALLPSHLSIRRQLRAISIGGPIRIIEVVCRRMVPTTILIHRGPVSIRRRWRYSPEADWHSDSAGAAAAIRVVVTHAAALVAVVACLDPASVAPIHTR